MTRISSFRATLIWVETVPAILANTLPPDAPYRFLGKAGGYARAFDECQNGKRRPDGLELPWDKPGNYFWKRYFNKEATKVFGAQAWEKFVPFRRRLDCQTITPNPAVTVSFEAFYAPQGVAVVAKIDYRGTLTPIRDVVDCALAARHGYRFTISGRTNVSMDHAADAALDSARHDAFGDVECAAGYNQPFSVASFIIGEVADIATPVGAGSDEHLALEAVTTWNPNFATQPPKPIADAKLPMHASAASDLMYGHGRARAIWLPRAFAQPAAGPVISCYHRNIMLASLQTLSLGEFVSWVAARHTGAQPVARILDERAKRAAALLQLMADGDQSTYRTTSVAHQFADAKWAPAVAVIRALPAA